MPTLFKLEPADVEYGALIASLDDLRASFDRLVEAAETLPTIAVVDELHKCRLLIAVDHGESMVTIQSGPDASGLSEEWISVGDPAKSGVRDFFLIGDHHTQLQAMHMIPALTAWQVIAHFYRTAERSGLVAWDYNSF